MSKIEWTDKTWNVITGCSAISPACENCYAKAMTKRLQGMARKELEKKTNLKCQECGFDFVLHSIIEENTEIGEESQAVCAGAYGGLDLHKAFNLPKYYLGWDRVVFHKEALQDILDKNKYPAGSKIFVNSMSDTFHEYIGPHYVTRVFDYMSRRRDLTFQILTKRAEDMFDYFNGYVFDGFLEELRLKNYFRSEMYKHIWFGVTAENQQYADERIPYLLRLKTLFKDYFHQNLKIFVSIEPCLENIDLSAYIQYLDWVILGGEKIPNNPKKARLMKWEWVDSIYNQCKKAGVPLFFKQWGNNPTNSCHTRAESCNEFPRD